MANYDLTQTGEEVQAYIDSIPVIDVSGTQSGSTIVLATNPYSAIAANYSADCGSLVRLTVGTDVYLIPVTEYDGSAYSGSVKSGNNYISITVSSSSASGAVSTPSFSTGEALSGVGIDDAPTSGSHNLVESSGVASALVSKLNVVDSEADFEIADENSYAIVEFNNGHIKTKNFDSSDPDVHVGDEADYDYCVEDNSGNIILGVQGGNLFTKRFNSVECLQRVTALEDAARPRQILCVGDSNTAGSGANVNYLGETLTTYYTYPTWMQTKTSDVTFVRLGVGGEPSATILGRLGGVPYVINEAVTLPADTSAVQISLKSSWINDEYTRLSVSPLVQGGSTEINPCVIDGIECTLSRNSSTGVYSIARTSAGTSTHIVIAGTPIYTHDGLTYNPRAIIFWIGANDTATATRTTEVTQKIKQSVDQFKIKDYLVLGLHSIKNDITVAMRQEQNRILQNAFGYRFVDILSYGSTKAIYDAIAKGYIDNSGNTYPTTTDLEYMAAGRVPPTLKSDDVHFNQEGYKVVADLVYNTLITLGII